MNCFADSAVMDPSCLLLIFGIPGSGKTLLTHSIVQQLAATTVQQNWTWLTIHYDDFYPPDTRSKMGDASGGLFDLKEARRKIHTCLEVLLSRNAELEGHGEEAVPFLDAELRREFPLFLKYLNSQQPIFSDTGRLKSGQQPPVFALDDNMPLRSMRFECYKVARKHKMGFAEICVTCSLSTALARNSARTTPIPDSTISAMGRSLEVPDPTHHPWERTSALLENDGGRQDFVMKGCECALTLTAEALKNPALPVQQVDTALQESCREANLNSCVHQADMILRKCVSEVLKGPLPGDVSKSEMASKVNLVRKGILTEVKSGTVICDRIRWEVSMLNYEQFKDIIVKIFHINFI